MYSCGFLGGFFPGTGKFTFPTCGVVRAENPIHRLMGGGEFPVGPEVGLYQFLIEFLPFKILNFSAFFMLKSVVFH